VTGTGPHWADDELAGVRAVRKAHADSIRANRPQGFFRKPALPETVQRNRIQGKYEYRGNMCPECYQARAANGVCGCDS
jgi:hypothetical protein